jgi:hypothetical protein
MAMILTRDLGTNSHPMWLANQSRTARAGEFRARPVLFTPGSTPVCAAQSSEIAELSQPHVG